MLCDGQQRILWIPPQTKIKVSVCSSNKIIYILVQTSLTMFSIQYQIGTGSCNGLGPNMQQPITWSNDDPDQYCKYSRHASVDIGGINILITVFSGLNLPWSDINIHFQCNMMTSSNGNFFHVTGPLCGEFTGHRWIPCIKGSAA